MADITTLEQYAVFINQMIKEVSERIEQAKGQMPIYNNLLAQLLFIKKVIVEEKRKPTFEETEAEMIGAIAVKNFEYDEPFMSNLTMISYIFGDTDENFLKDVLR